MRILFIGNSHTYFNDMPHTFKRMYHEATGIQPEVTMLAYSGRDLKWHMEEYFSLRFAILYGEYDYCIIQQQAHPFPDEDLTEKWLKEVIELCHIASTKPVITMTWAQKSEPEMTAVMSSFYRRMADKYDTMLNPVGEIFQKITAEHPETDLFWKDGAHASAYGSWLIAASLTYLLAGKDKLDVITDTAINFNVHFAQDSSRPEAETDRSKATVILEKDKTAIIKDAIKSLDSSFRY